MSESKEDVESCPVLSRFEEDAEAEDCVCEVIDTVLELVSQDISTKSVGMIENGLIAEVAMYKLQELVHLATVRHDGDWVEGQVLEVLQPDEEPIPPPVDNWARGSVPARVVKANESRFNHQMGLSDGTRTPSVSSMRSSSTRSRSTTHSRAVTSRNATRTISTPDTDAPRIIELDDEGGSFYGDNGSNMNSTGHMYDMLQKQKNRLKQLTHTDDTVKDEFQLLKEEVDRAAEDLKGKNYIFDQNGQIVMIQPLKSEQLPPFALNPSLNVNNTDSTLDHDSRKKSTGVGAVQQTKKKKKIRVAGSRGVEDKALFTPTTSLATTIAGNTVGMHVNEGVAIETTKMSKEGPPIPDDPRKLSRKEYFNRKATAAVTTSMDSTWGEESGNNDEGSFQSGSFDGNEASLLTGGSSSLTGGNRFKDINPLEGGRPKPQPTSVVSSAPETARSSQFGSSRRPSDDYGKKGKQKPALEPTKPSYQQQETVNLLHGGSHMQGPRDRLPSQVLHTRSEKKKYVVPAKPNGSVVGDDGDAQSFTSANSKKSTGTIKKERLAQALF
eukprot:CAMPEP_0114417728 /NCGR_PEP_ID=MMETSP0103-20121206/3118_1 /TAXON_ID=37642 ORGANISM="Paraphysomonas imperforata, Strain PA2" /NCGR_SAMPLE_ID=MMETSP0103 /ASSEMBLY_ACC=CAM_ASM_000201 /LENGTH=553 /DNA_ID=CAMNT_0001586039 /DNA_START=119 /DNA_END=1780 /DNA_ORIENTATION=-